MQNVLRTLTLAAAVVPVAGLATSAFGQARSWDGGTDADNNWSTPNNWTTDTAPPTTPALNEGWRLGEAANTEVVSNMDNNYAFGQLQIQGGTDGYTVNSSNGSAMSLAGFNNGTVMQMAGGVFNATLNVPVNIITGTTSTDGNRRTINPGTGAGGTPLRVLTFNETLTVDPTLTLRKLGGVLVLNAPNVITTTFEMNNHDTLIGDDLALGTATISNPTGNTIRILSSDGTARTLANNFATSGQGALVFTEAGGPDMTLNGNFALGVTGASTISTFGTGAGTVATMNGAITGVDPLSGLSKVGEGSLVINGPATYTGDTFVGNGTLVMNASPNSNTTVGGGTLAGSGSVRILSVFDDVGSTNPGGVLSPGDGMTADTFTAGRADFADGGSYLFNLLDVNAGAGTGWDLLALDGAVASTNPTANANLDLVGLVTPGGFTIDIDGSGAGFDATQDASFVIVDADDVTNFNAANFAIDSSGFTPDLMGGNFGVDVVGGDLVLTFTANVIPEPATGLALLGTAGLALIRRRR